MKGLRTFLKIGLFLWVSFGCISCSIYKDLAKPQKGKPAYQNIQASIQNAYQNDKNLQEKNQSLMPNEIDNALLPELSVDRFDNKDSVEQRFDIAVNEMPARSFFMGLIKGTKYNMVVSPSIQGSITLNLKQVTVPQVMEAVHDNYGYQFKQTSYGYEVYPAGLETRVFTVNYLDVNRSGQSNILVNSTQISQTPQNQSGSGGTSTRNTGLIQTGNMPKGASDTAPTSSVETASKSDFWKQLADSLKAMIGKKEGREVVVNPAAGIVIVKAEPSELDVVEKYLDSMQSFMTRQVIIEAKILEVQLSDGFQAGIDWNLLGISQTGNQKFSDDLNTFTTIFKLDSSFRGAFTTVVNLLSSQGNVQVLSSPRIATLNNQKAVIKVGSDQYYVTNVSSTTLAGTSTQNTQNVDLTPFFSGISLDVTPQIDPKGEIILHIHPMISSVTANEIQYTVNNQLQKVPSAKSTIRESDTIVRAENEQIVVIGGLMEDSTAENTASTPILDKAPVIGPLFRRTSQNATKSELVILLRPIVVNDKTWTKQLRDEAGRMQKLNRGFHFGTHPEVFGNTAEPKPPKPVVSRAKKK